MVGSVPLVGKLAYWHIGRGTSKREDLWNRRLKKHKARLRKIFERYESASDKQAYLKAHRKEIGEHRRVGKFQGKLNKLRRLSNELKSREETPNLKKRIDQVENRRTEMIKEYLKKGE